MLPVTAGADGLVGEDARPDLQALMSRDVGVLRDEKGLAIAAQELAVLASVADAQPGARSWETTNLQTARERAGPRCATAHRRPAARTGATITPSATTSSGAGTSTPRCARTGSSTPASC